MLSGECIICTFTVCVSGLYSLREYEDENFGKQFGESLAVFVVLMVLNTPMQVLSMPRLFSLLIAVVQCLTAYYIGMAQAKQQLAAGSGPVPTW